MALNVKYGAGDKYTDITHIFMRENLFSNDRIRIPYGKHFNFLFGDSCPNMCKYLCITYGKIKYIISERNNNTFILDLKKEEDEEDERVDREINIVYYAYIKDVVSSKKIIFEQLKELRKTGILGSSKLHICLTFDNCFQDTYISEIRDIVENAEFSISFVNSFEYPGIKKVWEIAQKSPDSVILYFHSKGMVFQNPTGKRIFHERVLFNTVVKTWKSILNILKDENINKVGYMCSAKGLCWFNFWWVKASYLINLAEPTITSDRYYYENYLGMGENRTDKDCYNLYDDSIGLGVEPVNVSHMINDYILKVEDDWLPDI